MLYIPNLVAGMQNSSEEDHRSEHETGEIRSSSRVMQDETLSKISPPRLVSRLPRFGGKENKSFPNLLPLSPPKKRKKRKM
jgi:hypothetical protein